MCYIIYKTTHIPTDMYYIGKHHQTIDDPYSFDGYYGSGTLLKQYLKSKEERKNLKRETLFWFETEEEAFKKEAEIVNEELLKDPKCMNLIVGGGVYGGYNAEVHKKWRDSFNNAVTGTKWMHNKELNISVKAHPGDFEALLRKGFVFGRPQALHEKVSKSMKGLQWIHRGEESKQIYEYDLQHFLEEGWTLGRNDSFSQSIKMSDLNKNRSRCMYKIMTDGTYNMIRVSTNDVEKYIADGYIFGSPLSGNATRNRIVISNPNTLCSKYVDENELEYWLNNGWVKGNLKNLGHIPWNKGLKGTKKKKITQ